MAQRYRVRIPGTETGRCPSCLQLGLTVTGVEVDYAAGTGRARLAYTAQCAECGLHVQRHDADGEIDYRWAVSRLVAAEIAERAAGGA